MDLLVIGLGNPGLKYINNRHNVGFKTVELLAEQLGVQFQKKLFQPYLYSSAHYRSHRIILVKPLTYMNNSGSVINSLFRKFKMNIKNLVVLCDNLDLDPGRCKFKLKGSPAAHNGLKSISGIIESNDYMRIYIGIGHPGRRDEVRDYVIGDPEKKELLKYDESYRNAASAVLNISEDLHERVMNELNRKKTGN